MTEVEVTQHAAARLLAINPDMPKTEITAMVGIGKTTLYTWLATEKFQRLIEEYRVTPAMNTDPDILMETLNTEDQRKALKILSKHTLDGSMNVKLREELDKLALRANAIENAERYENAITEVKKLIGRLEIVLYPWKANTYNADGSLKPITLEMHTRLSEDIEEQCLFAKALGQHVDPEEEELWKRWTMALKAARKVSWPGGLPDVLISEM